jgi:calcineurin-like phosphoesterase family protein
MIESLYPCFKCWSEKGSVYLISDTHFFDEDREYMGYDIPESVQIERIASVCHKNDTLIHLGDVGSVEWMNKIKAYKVLIMGNHDQSIEKMSKYFDEVYSGPLWISQKLVLSHEPIVVEDENGVPIAINIHGHDHSGEVWDYYHVNIVQNKYGYSPLNLKNFIKEGYLKRATDIHSITKEVAAERKNNKQWSMFSV